MADDDEGRPSGGGGLTKKIGPLPAWGWALGLGALGGLVWFWRRGKSATAAADSTAAGSTADTSPTSLIPISEGLSQTQMQSILDALKKLQGPDSDDDDDDGDDDDKPKPKPKPTPAPKPKPKPKPPRTVTVVKWTRHNTPWNSTLWGIANHEHVSGGWQYLQKINHIHGDPRKALQPGMKIRLSA